MAQETVETAIYRLRVEGQAEVDRLTKAIDELSVAEEKATASTRTTSEELQKQLARADPLLRAQQAYTKQLENIHRFQESGVGTQQEINALLEANTQRYQKSVTAIQQAETATTGLAEAHKGLNAQGQAAMHSIRSVFEQVALGTPITQALTGQLNHLTFAASGEGGIAGAFKQASGMLSGFASVVKEFITPLTAAGGVMAGFSAAAITAGVNWSNAQKDIERALAGIGRQSGTTVDDINRIGFAVAKTTDMSIGEARGLATSLAATGNITKENLEPATAAAQQLSKALGIDAASAAKMLGTALADPTKGVDALDAETKAFNVTTREQIAQAMRMGDVGQAQAIMLQRVQAATLNAAKANETWTDSFKDVWKWIKDTVNAEGEMAVRGAQILRHDFGGARPTTGVSTGDQLRQAQGELAGAQTTLSGMNEPTNRLQQLDLSKARQEVAKFTAEVERLKQTKLGEDLAAWNKQLDDAANSAGNAARSLTPEIDAIDKTKAAIAALNAAINVPDIGRGTQISAEFENARVKANNLLQTQEDSKAASDRMAISVAEIAARYSDLSQKAALTHQEAVNNLPVIQATTEAAKMLAQYAADYWNAVNKGTKGTDALQASTDRLRATWEAAYASVQKTTEQMQSQNELAKARDISDEKRIASQQAYDQVIKQLGDNEAGRAAAQERSSAVEESYRIRIKKSMEGTTQATEDASQAARNLETPLGKARDNAGHLYDVLHQSVGEMERFVNATSNLANGMVGVSNLAANLGKSYDESGFGTYPAGSQMSYTHPGATADQPTSYMSSPNVMKGGSFAAVPLEQQQYGAKYLGGGAGMRLETRDRFALSSEGYLDPEAVAKANQERLAGLTDSVDALKTSTDSLNRTNQELLSPYYTQDPRTSHIGFRSQGMASGGYVDVPGGYSANDNMTAIIPVASGERIYVDPMSSTRGHGGATINISAPMMFSGNVNRDEVGRTVYQQMQVAARSITAAAR